MNARGATLARLEPVQSNSGDHTGILVVCIWKYYRDPMNRPWHIRLALKRALCIVVSTEHYLSTIQHLLIIFNHMLPDRLGEG